MKRLRVYFEESPESTPLDTPLDALLIGTILFAPLALGSIDPKFEMVLQIATALCAAMFGIKLTLYPETRFVKSWIYLPMLGFIGLAALQLVPLPQGAVASISPETLSVKREFLSDLPDVSQAIQKLRLSFYAEPTLRQLRQVLMVSAIFVMVLNQFRTLAKIKTMLIALSCLGAFSSALALAQVISGTEYIYWFIYSGGGHAHGGTFANHSHFAQFTNLCIGAMLSLLFLLIHEQLGPHYRATDFFDRLRTEQGRPMLLLIAAIILSTIAVPVSLARAGTIALLIAGILTVSLYSLQNREGGFGWVGSMMATVVLAIIFYFAFDHVTKRYADLRDLEPATGRWAMVQGCLDCWRQFPMVGIGLGAFRYVYPRYDRLHDYAFATHAENEYAQLLMETGVIGMAMIVLFMVLVFAAYFRAVRHRASPYAVVAIGLGFGWIAILIQSASDFGQHMPGVALVTASVAALLVSITRAAAYDPARHQPAGWPVLRGLVTVGVIAGGALASMSAISIFRADARWLRVLAQEDSIIRDNWQVEPDRAIRLLKDAEEVVQIRPNSTIYRHLLNEFRLRAATMVRDPATGAILLNDRLTEGIGQLVREIDLTRVLCPTYGPAVASAGGVRLFYLEDSSGGPLIEKALILAPNDVTVLRMAAQLAASRGEWEKTMEILRHQIAVQPGTRTEAIELLVRRFHRPELAIQLIGSSPGADYLVRTLEQIKAEPALIAEARRNLIKLLIEQSAARVALPGDFLAIAAEYARLGENPNAEAWYQKAVNSSAADGATRLQYAEFLDRIGRTDDALKQIDVVLSIEPFNDRAANLKHQLRQPRKKDAED
jgi:O-antigen ligase/tetratricopeptide (TPR) repeat protein